MQYLLNIVFIYLRKSQYVFKITLIEYFILARVDAFIPEMVDAPSRTNEF